jgi:hypothetical protein
MLGENQAFFNAKCKSQNEKFLILRFLPAGRLILN